jgi:hypothetical protein
MSTGPQNAGQGQSQGGGQPSGQAPQVDPDVQQMAAQVGPNVEAAVRGHFQAQGGGGGGGTHPAMAGMAPGVAAGGGGLGQWVNIALTLLPVILQALKDAGLIKQPTP